MSRQDYKHMFDTDENSLIMTKEEAKRRHRHERKVLTYVIIANFAIWSIIIWRALERYAT